MSDGPHRSLNLRPHWKLAAQRAANLAHSPQEVSEAIAHALIKDVTGTPVSQVRDILSGDLLFADMRVDQLETLRSRYYGSTPAIGLIDCAIEAAVAGRFGDNAMLFSLCGVIEDLARPAIRSIDEHYQRRTSALESRLVRERLGAAFGALDCASMARELLAPSRPSSRRLVNLSLQTGVDQGPPL